MNNTDTWVAFDLDEVLCNLRDIACESFRRRTGINIHWQQWSAYEMYWSYGMTQSAFEAMLIEDRALERVTPEPNARRVVSAAGMAGFRTAIITSREYYPEGLAVTREWLRMNHIAVDEIILTGRTLTKNDALRQLGDTRIFVDDFPVNLHKALEVDPAPELYLLDRPWNRTDRRHRRVHQLIDLEPRIWAASRELFGNRRRRLRMNA